MRPEVTGFYDESTGTVSYLVVDPATRRAAIVDAVWDYNPRSGRLGTDSMQRVVDFAAHAGVTVEWLLDTHVHADHLSAIDLLKQRYAVPTGIGRLVSQVQKTWIEILNLAGEVAPDGSQFDHLFDDGERFKIGEMEVRVMHTPGHTPACSTYVVGDAAFIGDTLFMPDYGTARADFPGGDARTLYRSIRRILSLPPQTRLFTCHDYPPGGRAPAWESTVAEQRAGNVHVRDGVEEDAFVALRTARDRELDAPELLLPSLQVNIRGGRLPAPEDNGVVYLKIPIDRF